MRIRADDAVFPASVEMDRIVGKDRCVPITKDDIVIPVYRAERDIETRAVFGKDPVDTSLITVGLCLDDDGKHTMFTSFYGQLAPKEIGDPRLYVEERKNAEEFWKEHAVVIPEGAVDWERSAPKIADAIEKRPEVFRILYGAESEPVCSHEIDGSGSRAFLDKEGKVCIIASNVHAAERAAVQVFGENVGIHTRNGCCVADTAVTREAFVVTYAEPLEEAYGLEAGKIEADLSSETDIDQPEQTVEGKEKSGGREERGDDGDDSLSEI